MTELEICRESDGLIGSDEGDALKDHVRDGASRDHVSSNQLVHDLECNLLVGDGLEHAYRDCEKSSEYECDDKSPDRKLSWEDLDGDDHKDEGDNSHNGIPEMRYLGVRLHKARVDIALIPQRATESADDIATIPYEGVNDDSRERGERDTIGNRLCCRYEQGRVCLVFSRVESPVRENGRNVIWCAGVVKCLMRRNRQERCVQRVRILQAKG